MIILKNFLKKYKKTLILISLFIITILIFSFLNYTYIINDTIISIVNYILVIIYSIIFGIQRGIKGKSKGYIIGLKFGIPIILILFIFGRILNFPLYFSNILYYFIILISIIFGSIIGKNKKDQS